MNKGKEEIWKNIMKRSAHRDPAANNTRMKATRGADRGAVELIGDVQSGAQSSPCGKA
jgi:hypothetical protein